MTHRIRFLGVLLILLGAVLALPAPSAAAVCNKNAGSIHQMRYVSHLLNAEMTYSIYLPSCYAQSTRHYPVIYLLHGSGSDDTHWLQLGLADTLDMGIRTHKYPPMVVVLPNGGDSAETNLFDETSWANVFLTELLPHVEQTYRVSTQASRRAIGGISRGGFWAYHIALSNPKLFSAVGGHSAVFSPTIAPPQHNPIWLVVTAKEIDTVRFWLDRSVNDISGPTMNTVAQSMQQRGLTLEYNVYRTGSHNNDYWASHLEDYLQFYSAKWH
ncbi:MAG: alpha/beta hydrolase-fold protein [Chloroflexota bacterium]